MFREPAGKTRFLSPEEEARLYEKIGAPYAGWVRLAILIAMGTRGPGARCLDSSDDEGERRAVRSVE